MKKNLYSVACSLFLFACGDFKLAQKEIFVKDIPLYIYYDSYNVLPTSSGFYLQTKKSYTNGDSTKCELIAKTENILSKIDFEGNVVWQRIEDQRNYFDNLKEVGTSFYRLDSNYPNKLIKYDSFLQKVAITSLYFEKYITNHSVFLAGLDYWKDGKFFAHGTIISSGGKVYKYKQFFCILSIENGIEKFVLDDTEILDYMVYNYKIKPSGDIYGLAFKNDYTDRKTTFLLRRYDASFKLIASKEVVQTSYLSINSSKIIFKNDMIYLTSRDETKNINSILRFDKDFELKQEVISTDSNIGFITTTSSTDLLFMTYGTSSKIFKTSDDLKAEQIGEFKGYIYNPFVKIENNKAIIYNIESGGNYAKNTIEFVKNEGLNLFSRKKLYESQYSRKCYSGFD